MGRCSVALALQVILQKLARCTQENFKYGKGEEGSGEAHLRIGGLNEHERGIEVDEADGRN